MVEVDGKLLIGAQFIAHQGGDSLLVGGAQHELTAGLYSYLPLAWRSIRKIENIVRDEMDASLSVGA